MVPSGCKMVLPRYDHLSPTVSSASSFIGFIYRVIFHLTIHAISSTIPMRSARVESRPTNLNAIFEMLVMNVTLSIVS